VTQQPQQQGDGAAPATGEQCARITRRQFVLDSLVGVAVIGPLVAAIAGVVRYLIPPARAITGAKERTEVAAANELRNGQSKDFVHNDAPYALIRVDDKFRALSKACTHLGCIVEWQPDNRIFWCPCHNGVFDANGAVVSGPPPRPLPHLRVEVADGKVYVEG